jgi:hypothetical protein
MARGDSAGRGGVITAARSARGGGAGPPNWTRFSPMVSWRRGELDSLTLGRQQTTVAAGDGEAIRLASGIDAGRLQ